MKQNVIMISSLEQLEFQFKFKRISCFSHDVVVTTKVFNFYDNLMLMAYGKESNLLKIFNINDI